MVATLSSLFVTTLSPNFTTSSPHCHRYDLENKADKSDADAASIKALYGEFGKWHGISALANLGIVCAACAHGW